MHLPANPLRVAFTLALALTSPLATLADDSEMVQTTNAAGHYSETLALNDQGRDVDDLLTRFGFHSIELRKPKGGGGFSMTTTPDRVMLVEGAANGVEVILDVSRSGGKQRPVTLTLLADADSDALEYVFDTATLPVGSSRATLTLRLPIDMAPRLPHERMLRIRADDGRKTVETTVVVDIEPVDAPDIYLLIGQSNMEGYSEPDTKQAGPGELDEPVPGVQQLHVRPSNANAFIEPEDFTNEATNVASPLFIAAEDPLHDQSWYGRPKSGTRIGPGLSFGKAALSRTTRTVYLVPAAWGATGFCANAMGDIAWNAAPYAADGLGGTLLLERALTRLDMTIRETGGVLRGILWHQGGADANDPRCVASYADNLVQMVRRLRREAPLDARGPSARGDDAPIPFVLATQSKGSDERDNYTFNGGRVKIDEVHRTVANLLPFADYINNDDLVPPGYPCGQSSCVHFGAAALREQGQRFDAALERIRRNR